MSTSSPRRPPRHPPTPPPPSQRTPGASYPSTTSPFVVRHRNQSPSSDALRAAAASITRDGASTTRQAKPGRAASPAASLRSDASSSTADSTALRRAAADLAQRYGSRDSSRRGSLAEHDRGGQVGQGGGGGNQGDEDTVGLGSWAIGLPGSFPPSWENDSDDGDDTGHDRRDVVGSGLRRGKARHGGLIRRAVDKIAAVWEPSARTKGRGRASPSPSSSPPQAARKRRSSGTPTRPVRASDDVVNEQAVDDKSTARSNPTISTRQKAPVSSPVGQDVGRPQQQQHDDEETTAAAPQHALEQRGRLTARPGSRASLSVQRDLEGTSRLRDGGFFDHDDQTLTSSRAAGASEGLIRRARSLSVSSVVQRQTPGLREGGTSLRRSGSSSFFDADARQSIGGASSAGRDDSSVHVKRKTSGITTPPTTTTRTVADSRDDFFFSGASDGGSGARRSDAALSPRHGDSHADAPGEDERRSSRSQQQRGRESERTLSTATAGHHSLLRSDQGGGIDNNDDRDADSTRFQDESVLLSSAAMPLRPSSLRRTPSRPSRNGSHPYVRFDFDDFGNTAPTLSNAVSDNDYPKTQDSGGAAGATPTTTSPTGATTAYRPLRILRFFLVIFLLPLTLILFSPFILGFILSSSPFLTPAQAPPQTPAPTPLSSTALPIDHLIHAILQLSHGFDSGVSAFDDAAFAPCIAVWMGAELLSGTRQGADDGRSEVMRKFENIAVNDPSQTNWSHPCLRRQMAGVERRDAKARLVVLGDSDDTQTWRLGAEGIWPVAEVFLEIQGLVGGLEVVLVTLGATASQEAEHIRRLLVPEEATALAMTSPSYLALITRFWYTRVWHSTLALHEADDESSSQFPLWVRGVRTAITSPVWNLWLHYVFYGSWEPFPVSLRHHHTIMASALLNATSEVAGSLRQIQDLGVPCVDQLVAFQTKLASASHQTHLGPRFLDDVMRRDLEPVCKWARSQSAPVEGEAPYANLLDAVDTLQQLERRLQDIVDLSRRRGRATTGWRALSGPSDVQELEHRGRKMLGRQLWEIGGWIERWGIEDGRGGA